MLGRACGAGEGDRTHDILPGRKFLNRACCSDPRWSKALVWTSFARLADYPLCHYSVRGAPQGMHT